MKKITIFLLSMTSLLAADTGMWMPHQINMLNLNEQGLQIDPDELFKDDGSGLMNAIVKLTGATGEFVSDQGLILTNHHVGFGAIQRASDAEHDYLTNGFLADAKNLEIEAKGMTAEVLLEYKDVTAQVQKALAGEKDFRKRYDKLDKIEKKLVAQAEKAGPDIRAQVRSMYSGNAYYIFISKRLQDIRLVYAPPQSLGNFGGEIDNWMWPRHTCDFTFLRAYVSPTGEGAPFSAENVPYQPKSFLKISMAGFDEGDLTFVMGYPGRTFRNYTAKEVAMETDRMRETIASYQDIVNFLDAAGANDREIAIRYASAIKSLNNTLKNYTGKLQGFEAAKLIEIKRQAEAEFLANSPASAQENLQKLEAFLEQDAERSNLQRQLEQSVNKRFSSTLLGQAYNVYRIVQERQKPDADRETSYQERNIPNQIQWIQLADRGYDINVDKQFFIHQLKKMQQMPAQYIPTAFQQAFAATSPENFVENLYSKTIVADAQKCVEMLDYSPKKLMALNDPMINLAAQIDEQLQELREAEKSKSMEKQMLKQAYMQDMLAFHHGAIAPDANSTLRLTFGNIAGYSPKDAVYYKPQTTLSGVIAKAQDEEPFIVPEKLTELYASQDFNGYVDAKLGDVPACFLNTTNVTGGNSGSPTLNARGEQIGIIFDMTYESVIGDYYILPEFQRTISVDIRYVLFIVEKFDGAKWIIDELTLVK